RKPYHARARGVFCQAAQCHRPSLHHGRFIRRGPHHRWDIHLVALPDTGVAFMACTRMAGLKSFARAMALTIAISTLIAGALAATVPAIGGWGTALVNSLSIGILACTIIDGGRRVLWPGRAPPVLGMIALCLVG